MNRQSLLLHIVHPSIFIHFAGVVLHWQLTKQKPPASWLLWGILRYAQTKLVL